MEEWRYSLTIPDLGTRWWEMEGLNLRPFYMKSSNSVAYSPQKNYTDRAATAFRWS
jgi:hypothetical protein